MKTENRTLQQNKAYFLFHDFVADEMNSQGITLDKLVVQVKPRPTKDSLHEIFKSILFSMYKKDSTKGMTREEMQNCMEVYMEALATIGVHIEFPEASVKHLLQYY